MLHTLQLATRDTLYEDHAAKEDEEEAMRRSLALVLDEDQLALPGKLGQAMQVEICSCGHFTCGLITRYGLLVPTFTDEIEPIRSQSRRDVRALEIRGAS